MNARLGSSVVAGTLLIVLTACSGDSQDSLFWRPQAGADSGDADSAGDPSPLDAATTADSAGGAGNAGDAAPDSPPNTDGADGFGGRDATTDSDTRDSDGALPPNLCSESAKLIYLLDTDGALHSFDPRVEGLAAYKPVASVQCGSSGSPQSMSVGRSGTALVFYDSGEMFRVDTSTGKCSPTTYKHPAPAPTAQTMGMGFTATSPGSKEERLYVQSPDFGLAVVDPKSFEIDEKGVFQGVMAELTGGADARLFRFESSSATLAEISQDTLQLTPMHAFNLANVSAFAFARYAGKFYVFTAQSQFPTFGTSNTNVFDPATGSEKVRDDSIGFTVVGAGQSTCVPLTAEDQ